MPDVLEPFGGIVTYRQLGPDGSLTLLVETDGLTRTCYMPGPIGGVVRTGDRVRCTKNRLGKPADRIDVTELYNVDTGGLVTTLTPPPWRRAARLLLSGLRLFGVPIIVGVVLSFIEARHSRTASPTNWLWIPVGGMLVVTAAIAVVTATLYLGRRRPKAHADAAWVRKASGFAQLAVGILAASFAVGAAYFAAVALKSL